MNQWHPLFTQLLRAVVEAHYEVRTTVPVQHLVFLVSSVDLPVEQDSPPLHVIGVEPPEVERAVVQLVASEPDLQMQYGGFLASLHSQAWKEFESMARSKGKQLLFDIRPAIESLGLARVIEQVGLDRVIEQVGLDRVIEQVGLDRVIEQVGLDRVIEKVGEEKVIQRIGVDKLLATLSPAQRRELKRRLTVE